MTMPELTKPSYEEWMYWSQVIIDRLTTVVHVYNKPPYDDVFMAEGERQLKVSQTVDLLRRLHMQTDEGELKIPRQPGAREQVEERLVAALTPLFRDVLHRLPTWSADMQALLKSPWYENCNGKLASILFCGPEHHESEGLGSGFPQHGRLPETLQNLLERETMGDSRPSSEQPKTGLRRDEVARRWGQRNSSFLRSAGRVD